MEGQEEQQAQQVEGQEEQDTNAATELGEAQPSSERADAVPGDKQGDVQEEPSQGPEFALERGDVGGGEGQGQGRGKRRPRPLREVAENFLAEYCKEEGAVVDLDKASCQLGVARRRIYDVLNVLSALQMVEKQFKGR